MADDYCVHEMLRETCGICTSRETSAEALERRARECPMCHQVGKHGTVPHPVFGADKALRCPNEGIEQGRTVPVFRRAGGPLLAQYESRCPECHDMIEPGEPIVKDPRIDLYVHEGCA